MSCKTLGRLVIAILCTSAAAPISAGPGASFFLVELLLGQPTNSTLKTTCDSTLWVVSGKALLRLAATWPELVLELGLRMSQDMKQQLGRLEAIQQVGCM